jgi:hypothetical protein
LIEGPIGVNGSLVLAAAGAVTLLPGRRPVAPAAAEREPVAA